MKSLSTGALVLTLLGSHFSDTFDRVPLVVAYELNMPVQGGSGDFDNDTDVDGVDFLACHRNASVSSLSDWEAGFGTTSSGGLSATHAVPEPSCLFLVCFGTVCTPVHRFTRKLLLSAAIAIVRIHAAFEVLAVEPAHGTLPNVVVIFIDDMGYADIGPFGAEGYETPHLDRMAREGRIFTDFHAGSAVCSASRAALLTGCYPRRVGIEGALMPGDKYGLNSDELTLAEVCKQRSYATGIFGKWHLGDHEPFLPLQHGFDEYFGLPYSNDMWPHPYVTGQPIPERKSKHPNLPLLEGNEVVDADVTQRR